MEFERTLTYTQRGSYILTVPIDIIRFLELDKNKKVNFKLKVKLKAEKNKHGQKFCSFWPKGR